MILNMETTAIIILLSMFAVFYIGIAITNVIAKKELIKEKSKKYFYLIGMFIALLVYFIGMGALTMLSKNSPTSTKTLFL